MNKDLSLITKYTDDDLVIYKDGSSGYDDTFSGDLSGSDYKNYDWITSFYKKFVSKLKDDDIVTIYECSK